VRPQAAASAQRAHPVSSSRDQQPQTGSGLRPEVLDYRKSTVRVRTAHRKPAGRRRSPIYSSSRKPNLAWPYSSCGPHADLATRGPPRWAADRQTAAQQRATCSSPHPEPAPERSCEILMNRDRLLGMHSLSTPVTQFQWRCAPSRYRCDGGHRGHGDVARRGRCVNWVPGRLSLAAGALCWHPVSPEGSPIRCGWRAWRVRPATAAPLRSPVCQSRAVSDRQS
jgi:hypothetical protein